MPEKVHILPQEWRWAVSWSLAILLLSCGPYLIAAQMAPAGWQFAGIMVNPFDGQSYLAKMQQGREGQWLFHLTYTPESHDGAFIFTFYLALGHVAALTGLPLIWVFHLARLAAGFALLMVAFRFIALVTPQVNERRLAFVLLLSAAGLGWLGIMGGAFPIDLWVPEAFTPYSLYANPHFPLGMALMLTIFQFVVWPGEATKCGGDEVRRQRSAETKERRSAEAKERIGESETLSMSNSENEPPTRHPVSSRQSKIQNLKSKIPWTARQGRQNPKSKILYSGLAGLALALILPFALLTVWATLAVYLAWFYLTRRRWPWPQIWPALGAGLFSAPVIVYDYWLSISHPILAGWSAQNVTPAPAVMDLVLGYGLVGLLAMVGGWSIIRNDRHNQEPGEWLVLLWAVTTVVLVYLPFDLQRRLITGLHIPVCILAALGLSRWLSRSRLKMGRRRLITRTVVALGALGTLAVWGLPLIGMRQSPLESETTALFFLRREEIAALTWLRENSGPDDTVLASPRLGLFVPGQTGARTFYGHPFETVEAKTKKAMVEAFYRGEIEAVSPPVDFIIYGPAEQSLGRPKNLAAYPVVFSGGDVMIYKATQ